MAQKKITDLQLKASVLGTENLPVDDTIQSYRVTFSQVFDYIRSRIFPEVAELSNLTIVPSVSASALTIAVKTRAGANASATDLIRVGVRDATLTSGSYNTRTITAALSMVVSSGSTLGQVSGQASRIYIYLIDNGGVLELAVSSRKFRENELVSTTAEGGAGGADAADVMYSTTARTNVPCRLIGYIDNTQTTAGTWASAGTQVQLAPFEGIRPAQIIKYTSGSGTHYPTVGCTRFKLKMVGGGGNGTTTGATAGSGGGAGAYVEHMFKDGIAKSYAYGVGPAATASTFGTLTAGGGATGAAQYLPGGGGTPSGSPDVGINGADGFAGQGHTGGLFFSGAGANSVFGGGGYAGGTAIGTGAAGRAPGAGGGSGANGGAGGAGQPGIIIIEEFFD